MTDLQKKELEILKSFVEICDRIGVKYYLVCGSALGAVKYKGFIPWDDDIDVAMLRDDYEKFCSEAPQLLPEHLFLQTYKTDSAYPAIYAKLRDSGTTFIESSVAKLPIHHGIGMDIFPLDGYPQGKKQAMLLELRKWIYVRLLSSVCERPTRWKNFALLPMRLLGIGRHTAHIAQSYEKMIRKFAANDSIVLANHGNWQGALDYTPREVFGSGAAAEFEDLTVRIPEQYEAYLERKYGDFWADPPVQKSHHVLQKIDTQNPYTVYMIKDQK